MAPSLDLIYDDPDGLLLLHYNFFFEKLFNSDKYAPFAVVRKKTTL